jgi:hypothetical protein
MAITCRTEQQLAHGIGKRERGNNRGRSGERLPELRREPRQHCVHHALRGAAPEGSQRERQYGAQDCPVGVLLHGRH